jgi:serine O-acetyltransferase
VKGYIDNFDLPNIHPKPKTLNPRQNLSMTSVCQIKTESELSRQVANRLAEKLAATRPRIGELAETDVLCKSSIADLISTIKQILFPGYCDAPPASSASLQDFLATSVERLLDQLAKQVAIAHLLDQRFTAENTQQEFMVQTASEQVAVVGRELASQFIARLPLLRETLSTDIQAAYEGDPACRNLGEVIFCYPGLQAVLVYRVAHELYQLGVPLLPRMIAEWVHGETGIDIHPGACIGPYFFIDHGTGVVIGQTCEIGQRVKIYQGVTLGALSFPTDGTGALVRDTKRHPTIQDNVVIYANATVLGGRTVIGHDSVIGSSVWITRSVEPFTTIVMEKPRLHLRDGTPEHFRAVLDYQI